MVSTAQLVSFFLDTRSHTEHLCKPLEIEDYVVQPIEDVSPPKWHLGHTTWFFEEFILKAYQDSYQVFDEDFAFVFNSYYENIGTRVIRSNRGNLSRPDVAKVYDYRHHVTEAIANLIENGINDVLYEVLLIGIHHEKQHQELLLTDIKYILGNNPLLPIYSNSIIENSVEILSDSWTSVSEGIYQIGHKSNDFCYDNELGNHQVFLHEFSISNSLVKNSEYMEFMKAGGYEDFNLWHADGWNWVQENQISKPMYWHEIHNKWQHYTLNGIQPLEPLAPVTHISYYEAFAFAQWKNCRLPTEFEWEASQEIFEWGKRWEWTESAYLPYPGYQKAPGALGEYNGKFMVNQKVLRGGSVATPINHTRSTYRNFFQPELRWQFTGIRLAK